MNIEEKLESSVGQFVTVSIFTSCYHRMFAGKLYNVDSNGSLLWLTINEETHEFVKDKLSFDEEDGAICCGDEVAIYLEAA